MWDKNFEFLIPNYIALGIVIGIQLMHRIAEQTAVLVLSLVLSHQLGLLLTRASQLTGRHFSGLLVRAEIHIAVLAHFLFHALNERHRLNFCHS